jgi:hypothetical protein
MVKKPSKENPMKLRVVQVLFVAVSLLCAAMIVHHGQPRLIPATQAQGDPDPDFMAPGGVFRAARPADEHAADASISAQLDAFRRDDFRTAVRYQSEALRSRFPSVAVFRQMMRSEYPAFLHFHDVAFHGARTPDQGKHLFVFVALRQRDGSRVEAVYSMVEEGGSYKVDGVRNGMWSPGPAPDGGSQLT